LQARLSDKQPIFARVTLKVAILLSRMLMFSFFLGLVIHQTEDHVLYFQFTQKCKGLIWFFLSGNTWNSLHLVYKVQLYLNWWQLMFYASL